MANRDVTTRLFKCSLVLWATWIMLLVPPVCHATASAMVTNQLVTLTNSQLVDMGQAYWDKNRMDSALICFSVISGRADRKQSRDDMRLVCAATTAMGNIWMNRFYDYERAMQCMLKAQHIAQEQKFNPQLADIYELMAVLEDGKNDIQNDFAFNAASFSLHQRAFQLCVNSDGPQHVIVLAIINMTTAAMGHHKLDMIRDMLDTFQSLEISDTIPACRFAKHQCAAAIYTHQGQYDKALNELAQLESSIDMIDHVRPIYQAIACENRFFVYRDMNDATAALRELEAMERIALDNGIKNAYIEVLLHKRNYHTSMGQAQLANDCDLRYHKAKDQFNAEAKVAKADEEKVLFRLNEANHEIKELSYKQRIQQTRLVAVTAVALLLLALLVLAWIIHRRTQQKNKLLYDQNQQLLANVDRLRRMRQEQMAQETQDHEAPQEEHTTKYSRTRMEHDDVTQVMDKVERVLDSSPEIFKTEFSLDRLAELTGESRTRLSQAINQEPGRSFYSLLNEYRVREACRRMNDKNHFGGLTIEAIAQGVGFKSRSNFVTTFKRITGLTPSAYLKQGDSRRPASDRD